MYHDFFSAGPVLCWPLPLRLVSLFVGYLGVRQGKLHIFAVIQVSRHLPLWSSPAGHPQTCCFAQFEPIRVPDITAVILNRTRLPNVVRMTSLLWFFLEQHNGNRVYLGTSTQ